VNLDWTCFFSHVVSYPNESKIADKLHCITDCLSVIFKVRNECKGGVHSAARWGSRRRASPNCVSRVMKSAYKIYGGNHGRVVANYYESCEGTALLGHNPRSGKGKHGPAASMETRLRKKAMETTERSLRFMVEKWLMMAPATAVRVTRGSRARSYRMRYVCVEALQSTGAFAIYFFRQGDGNWCVFPPDAERQAMSVS
jgi:hypothetical protein